MSITDYILIVKDFYLMGKRIRSKIIATVLVQVL